MQQQTSSLAIRLIHSQYICTSISDIHCDWYSNVKNGVADSGQTILLGLIHTEGLHLRQRYFYLPVAWHGLYPRTVFY